MDKKKIRRIIAREGLLFILVSTLAFIITQISVLQNWVVSTGIAHLSLPSVVLRERYTVLELGEIIFKRASIIIFLAILSLYGFGRFILWAIKTLKER